LLGGSYEGKKIPPTLGLLIYRHIDEFANLGIADWTNSAEWVAAFQASLSDMNALFTLIGGIILAFVVLFMSSLYC